MIVEEVEKYFGGDIDGNIKINCIDCDREIFRDKKQHEQIMSWTKLNKYPKCFGCMNKLDQAQVLHELV